MISSAVYLRHLDKIVSIECFKPADDVDIENLFSKTMDFGT